MATGQEIAKEAQAATTDRLDRADRSLEYAVEHKDGNFPIRFRRSDLTELLLHLVVQLQQGCGHPDCSSKTCFTYRKRHTQAPLAPYTPLTAYYIALTIAERQDAVALSCPFISIHTSKAPYRLRFLAVENRCSSTAIIDRKSLAQQLVLSAPVMSLLDYQPAGVPPRWIGKDDVLIEGLRVSDDEDMRAFARRLLSLIQRRSPGLERQDLRCLGTIASYFRRSHPLDSVNVIPPISCLRQLDVLDRDVLKKSWTRLLRTIFETHEVLGMSFSSGLKPKTTLFEDIRCLVQDYPVVLDYMVAAVEDCLLQNAHTMPDGPRNVSMPASPRHITSILAILVSGLCCFQPPDASDRPDTVNGNFDGTSARAVRNSAYRMIHIITRYLSLEDMPKVFSAITRFLIEERQIDAASVESTWTLWLRSALIRHWDGAATVISPSATMTTLLWMASMWRKRHRSELNLPDEVFQVPRLIECLDVYATCNMWYLDKDVPADEKAALIIDFNFLLGPQALIQFCRGYCSHQMRAAVAATELAEEMRIRALTYLQRNDQTYLDTRMKIARQDQLVLKINRESVLMDAYNQLWQRERRELQRPLRVRLGMDTGELGHDLGGVQIEFFNLALAEAFDPSHSLFTTDPDTHLAWLNPGSLEPLFKYELLGMLIGLAIYNNITLPVSLPVVFYKKLLGERTTRDDLEENWPDLHRGLGELLKHEGNVEDDLATEFVYTMTANGVHLSIDMHDPWDGTDDPSVPGPGVLRVFSLRDQYPPASDRGAAAEPQLPKTESKSVESDSRSDEDSRVDRGSRDVQTESEVPDISVLGIDDVDVDRESTLAGPVDQRAGPRAARSAGRGIDWPGWTVTPASDSPRPVTNSNRLQYAQQYADWLLDYSVRPQFYAIARGVYSVVDPVCLTRLFLHRPNDLRDFVQGSTTLDTSALRSMTRYGHDCSEDSAVVKWFWEVLEECSDDGRRALLEFVTACPRLPMGATSAASAVGNDSRTADDTSRPQPVPIFKISLDRDEEVSERAQTRLPSSSTCFRTLYLPEYASKEQLRAKLDVALEHSHGFGRA